MDESRESILRARGWSIQSDGAATADTDQLNFDVTTANITVDAHHTIATDDEQFDDASFEGNQDLEGQPEKHATMPREGKSSSMSKSKQEHLPFVIDDQFADAEESPTKQEKSHNAVASSSVSINDNTRKELNCGTKSEESSRIRELAQSRLSKWAARLFDPDRPRGLIEPPQTIPLNDEFLQAFGKRVQQDDNRLGISHDIDPTIDDGDESGSGLPASNNAASTTDNLLDRKVKISNLKFTTTQAKLLHACQVYGDVDEVNLLMDDDSPHLNRGRAYVTFADPVAAQACVLGLTQLDGRLLRLFLASTAEAKQPFSTRGGGTAGGGARYWLADISTKCFRCGEVGHVERDCPNEPAPKPCPLCAQTSHDLRECPQKSCCFNCSLPGHVSRDCPQPRGRVPRRVVCTLCLQSGHHRTECRFFHPSNHNGPPPQRFEYQGSAMCLVCHKTGHYCCQESKWFFGLDTVTCWNCGRVGHDGYACDRPKLEVCGRQEQVAIQEIERASTWSTAEEYLAERQLTAASVRSRSDGFSIAPAGLRPSGEEHATPSNVDESERERQ